MSSFIACLDRNKIVKPQIKDAPSKVIQGVKPLELLVGDLNTIPIKKPTAVTFKDVESFGADRKVGKIGPRSHLFLECHLQNA